MSAGWCCSCANACGREISRYDPDMAHVNLRNSEKAPIEALPECYSGSKENLDLDEESEEEEDAKCEDGLWDETASNQEVLERRTNVDDRIAYTRREFIELFGDEEGLRRWEQSPKARGSRCGSEAKSEHRQHDAAIDEELGLYRITNPVLVRTKVETASPQVDNGKLDIGTFVEVVEVLQVEDRIRARIQSPAGWISLRRPTTQDEWAEKAVNDPGIYQVVRESVIREDMDLESYEVEGSPLEVGTYVNAIEVIHVDDRIRGRIDEPPGWITILSTSTPGTRFATQAMDKPGQYRLLDDAIIRERCDIDSLKVNNGEMLLKHLVVNVVEVRYESYRIRARLKEPAGWITLLKTDITKRMAERIEEEVIADAKGEPKVSVNGAHNRLNHYKHLDSNEGETVPLASVKQTNGGERSTSRYWTVCLIILCLPFVPGAVFSHIAFGKLLPPLENLPGNVIIGFDDVFKFASLEQDAQSVQQSAQAAEAKCLSAGETCSSTSFANAATQVDTTTEKGEITAAFARSLAIVRQVAGDIYFGTSGLQNTYTDLSKITEDLEQISGSMPCAAALPLYCSIDSTAGSIIAGMSAVDDAIGTFKNSEIVDTYEEHSTQFKFAHAFPYVFLIGLLFFLLFLCMGGKCCCCGGGCCRGSGCKAINIFYVSVFFLFWLIAFLLYGAVFATRILLDTSISKLTMLKGEPSVGDAADHIETTFPAFWNVVFKDLVDGLEKLWLASTFLLSATLAIGFFGICECCCLPYKRR